MKTKRFYTYILLCADDSYYTGMTNNILRRLSEHENARSEKAFTASRLPVKLVYCEEFAKPMDAIRREKQIKGWSRAKKEALIEFRKDDLPFLAMNSESKVRLRQAQSDLGEKRTQTELDKSEL